MTEDFIHEPELAVTPEELLEHLARHRDSCSEADPRYSAPASRGDLAIADASAAQNALYTAQMLLFILNELKDIRAAIEARK